MKRRNFLKILPAAGAVSSIAVNGHAMRPFANSQIARILNSCDGVEERVLVLIQLKGGNDGLNAFVPLNQYDTYRNLRPTIGIEENSMLTLDSTQSDEKQLGIHPAFAHFKALYEKGWAAVVQGVGYENMNQSHFKGTDLWLSGGDTTAANSNIGTGWMGRSLQALFPDVYGVPTAQMPDPLGIQIGDPNPNLGFHTATQHQNSINLSGQDPAGFFSLVQSIGGAPILNIPDTDQGLELAYIMDVENSTNAYAQRITDVFDAGSNHIFPYPTTDDKSKLAAQLATIARMIRGGCKTKMYLCQLGGFDTHSAQVDSGDTSMGDHANLLLELAESVKYFMDDLEGLGLADQVLVCTFSEFGRCARENGSFGTDHGTLEPMMLFGKNVAAGVNGINVNLSNLTNDNQLQGLQFDYRQVFTTVLQDWLGAGGDVLDDAMFSGYAKLPLIDDGFVVSPECYLPVTVASHEPGLTAKPLTIFPNPASVMAEVNFENSGMPFDARVTLHSLGGTLVTGYNTYVAQGSNVFFLELGTVPPGPYFVRLENKHNGKASVAKLNVVR